MQSFGIEFAAQLWYSFCIKAKTNVCVYMCVRLHVFGTDYAYKIGITNLPFNHFRFGTVFAE
jgi:hypothetical protein